VAFRIGENTEVPKVLTNSPDGKYNLGYVRQMAFSEDSKTLLVRCDAISGKATAMSNPTTATYNP
jgi:hypothetical protein